MADENLSVPPRVGDPDPEDVTLEAELVNENAEREIDKAVRGRRGIARKYVKWVRRRNPDATPAEIISMLEHHYVTAISVAGAAITVGSIAGEIGIAMIPVAGAAAAGTKAAAKEAGKKATKEAAKATAKQTAKAAAKLCVPRISSTALTSTVARPALGDAEDVHVPGVYFHDEQHVQATEEDCVEHGKNRRPAAHASERGGTSARRCRSRGALADVRREGSAGRLPR